MSEAGERPAVRHFRRSEQIGKLAEALSKAQG